MGTSSCDDLVTVSHHRFNPLNRGNAMGTRFEVLSFS